MHTSDASTESLATGRLVRAPECLLFLARAKFGVSTTDAVYRGIQFRFREFVDLSAIDETLVRGEYQFIAPVLAAIHDPLVVDIGMMSATFPSSRWPPNPRSRIVGVEADVDTAALARSNAPQRQEGSWTVLHRAGLEKQ